uniref:Uncharacterized protein n=1 Tax=Haptolina brevifila TaxID=156173 RepID=A0A7S2JLQ1_9EUKA|mmetsp:Transcript_85402/g.170478  ORF Transcript_85402/g.170478 Transcript_85402/m.170478 type:complete len:122 (+) Transcript_85402:80-445(+)|eukprot:CAMPEP_0174719666 /NCGR_PEP_ID=MMETSP1094-20130205/31678_1 /TAXON_ID=156173 /ORGANISM="Chrysochromulina brevifilum, Strain UTEX LB 985" /LENGTH=121 /DNA_ID=CAMNT_0015920007 /DNA_START=79 /DNA_END=444 /DNA_ORIENTATION=+
MPFEGFKGGGYDRSAMIRLPYSRTQLPIVASSEQFAMLRPVHPSLQSAFAPARRYESNLTTPYGRPFTSNNAPGYSDFSGSLMAASFHGEQVKPGTPSIVGEISAPAYKAWRTRESVLRSS